MKRQIKKLFVLLISFGLLMMGVFVPFGYPQNKKAQSQPSTDVKSEFIQNLSNSVSTAVANLGFDYRKRPVIGVLVADFVNPAGEETEIGNQIALELRAILNEGSQFHVYGIDHPLSQSLKASMAADPKWKVSSQRNFQQNILYKFRMSPVDVIITGQVSQESGDRIKVVVNLIPFYKPISLVETESGRTDVQTKEFISPPVSNQVIAQGLAGIKKPILKRGRLIIVASMKIKKGRYTDREFLSSTDRSSTKIIWDTGEPTGKTMPLRDINCWLDDKEISILKTWEPSKKKEYLDILSGLGADTIWFDDMVEEGNHTIFFSLSHDPAKGDIKTFYRNVSIKSKTTNFLFFSFHTNLEGEIEVGIRHIVDPENRSIPF